jgi:hypothetical protein
LCGLVSAREEKDELIPARGIMDAKNTGYGVGRKSGIAGFSLTGAINKKLVHRAMQIYRPRI